MPNILTSFILDLVTATPDAEKVNYRLPGFFSKFFELQRVMWTTNAGLTDRHSFDSRPTSWLSMKRGIVSFLISHNVESSTDRSDQNFWVRDHRQIYLLGNPLVWWLSTVAVFVFAGAQALLILRWKRQYKDFNNSTFRDAQSLSRVVSDKLSLRLCGQISRDVRISRCWLVPPLLPLLPDVASALPPPLLPRTLLRHSPILFALRSGHIQSEAESAPPGSWGVHHGRNLYVVSLQLPNLRGRVDQK